jgi:ribosomal protein S18 acetylase RimI-like enzyme
MHVELLNLSKIEPKIKDQLVQLHNDLDSEMKQYDPTIPIDNNNDLINIWKQNNAKIFIIYNNPDEIIGYSAVRQNETIPNLFYLTKIIIAKQYRKQNIGQYFLTEIENYIRNKLHGTILELTVFNNNTVARKLYANNDYKTFALIQRKKLK